MATEGNTISTGILEFRAEHFRCLREIVFKPDPAINLILGPNASGKTSLLEAIYFLGRGRSFLTTSRQALIETGSREFTLFGRIDATGPGQRIGVRVTGALQEVHLDGEAGGTRADLAAFLPIQVIDADVHTLVQGGPERRRRFMDWGAFHVKHHFLPCWQRYRRALQQRNTALKQKADHSTVAAWDNELVEAGEGVDTERRAYIELFSPLFAEFTRRLLGLDAKCSYLSGWSEGQGFAEALAGSQIKDRTYGATQVGPHRAELKLELDSYKAKHRVSRGQQKLIGIALILAQSQLVADIVDRRVLMLVDEPKAELDSERLGLLMETLQDAPAQLFITGLEKDGLPGTTNARVFHVEHGRLQA